MRWFYNWNGSCDYFTSMQCINSMHGMNGGTGTWYQLLVGAMEQGYDKVHQLHLAVVGQGRHGEQ